MANFFSKRDLYRHCSSFADQRIARIQNQIVEIQKALNSETKSSAGDKHETGRAMLQIEREKSGNQLNEAEKMQEVLAKVDLQCDTTTIGLGNVVRTSKNHYFLAISAGEFMVDNTAVYCISIGTPIAQLLLGKSIGEEVIFRGEHIQILEIT